jgi:hypothetical protein
MTEDGCASVAKVGCAMDKKVAADVAYLREKADHFRKLAAKAKADRNPMGDRLEKLANDLDARADEIEQLGEPLSTDPSGPPVQKH